MIKREGIHTPLISAIEEMILEFLSLFAAFFFVIFFIKKQWQNLPPSPIALPIIGHLHLLGPLIHQSFRDISLRYGPLFHLKLGSVSCIVASTPELAQEFLKTHELTFSSRKHSIAIANLTYNSSFAFSPYGPYWRFIKKISTFELLGNRMMNQFLPVRTKELHNFLYGFYEKSKVGENVNVTEELIKFSNNVISQMMLGVRSSDSDSEAETVRFVIREVTQIFGEFNVSDFIWLFKNINFQGFRKRVDDIFIKYDGLLERLITEREKQRNKNEIKHQSFDFLDVMLDFMEDENAEIKLTRDHIKALFLDFFTAATDTTAITLEWALAELIKNPQVLEKARDEINRVVGNKRIVQESDNSNLHYIQAILKETFRLHPPIPMLARKSIQDCHINGYKIPANSLLFVNIWAIGRDSKYWKNPLSFEPERFLNSRKFDLRGQNYELLPFGSGRRSCPGIGLAMAELPTTLAAMIQCFDWTVLNPPDMTERPGLTAPRMHDLVCNPVALIPCVLDPLLSSG
ncbi:cytochrome P450 93B2-like [Mercurialis annua]|uniref:cytochrome P450 93B2-like n=1 Tax=Mercurialis annua TaxID=3986 RepID=UPI002160E87D|nr:cytochrome P450 93B2-like [Mercurialis annua]